MSAKPKVTVHRSTSQVKSATILIADYIAAERIARSTRGTLPARHPARLAANGKSQSARRQLQRAGILFSDLCHVCHAQGVVYFDATTAKRCEMCEGTGYSERHNARCPFCKGDGFYKSEWLPRDWRIEQCPNCHGERIEPRNNITRLDDAFDGDKRAASWGS